MLTKVAYRLRWFLVLYVVILAAFASSFYIMTKSEGGGFKAMIVIAYMLGLGEFDEDLTTWENARVEVLMQGFFLFSTLAVLVVMMNLLIAEASAAY